MTAHPLSQLPPAPMAGPDWAEIARQLHHAEQGTASTDVKLRAGGQPVLIDPSGQATQLSRLPAARMAADDPVPPGAAVPTVRLTDGALAAIAAGLTTVAPERGGALLGVGGLTHLFVADTQGRYSPASWDISAELTTALGALEQAGHGVLTGTVHSHPRGVPDPSGTDLRTTAAALQLNPHLDRLLIAIVTAGVAREFDVAIGSGHRMSVHVLARSPESSAPAAATCSRARVEIVPLHADLAAAGLQLGAHTGVDDWVDMVTKTARVPDHASLAHTTRVGGAHSLIVPLPADPCRALTFGDGYPQIGPVALQVDDDGVGTRDVAWDPAAPAAAQLAALAAVDPATALDGATDRVRDLVGSLTARTVLIAGLGSVGSRIADDLVRAGVGEVILVDPDIVTAPNLARSVYLTADVGAPKPAALARQLRAISPGVRLATRPVAINDLDLPATLESVDLVIAATDDMAQQGLLAHHAYARSVPLVACALYRKAAAGEVVLQVPAADTACWSCAVGVGSAAAGRRPETDYGADGRLVGESALGSAIGIVTSVASQVALGLLAGPDSPAGQPLRALLTEGRTMGLVATVPDWDFFPTLFAGMAHQHAPQSVWPMVSPTPGCSVCGKRRQAPMTADEGAAVAADLRRLVEEEHQPCAPPALRHRARTRSATTRSRRTRRSRRRALLAVLAAIGIAAVTWMLTPHPRTPTAHSAPTQLAPTAGVPQP